MKDIVLNLWFDNNAEEAATFYVSLFPDSRIDAVKRAPADNPHNPGVRKGDALVVEFTLRGRKITGINGGPMFPQTEAASLLIECETQGEVDRYWDALISKGGSPSQCGWCKDRFGVNWQVSPLRLDELMWSGDDPAAERVMAAMLTMSKLDISALEAAARPVSSPTDPAR